MQKSEPIQPKTSDILPKFCQPTLSDVSEGSTSCTAGPEEDQRADEHGAPPPHRRCRGSNPPFGGFKAGRRRKKNVSIAHELFRTFLSGRSAMFPFFSYTPCERYSDIRSAQTQCRRFHGRKQILQNFVRCSSNFSEFLEILVIF